MIVPEKRIDILKSAALCFARYGYDKTTLEDIGKAVDLNKASLYYYYKNKEAIFVDVISSEIDQLIRKLQHQNKSVAGNFKTRILHYITTRLEYILEMINLNQFISESILNVKPMFDNLYNVTLSKEIDYLSSIVDNYISEGEIINCDSKRVAASILFITDAIRNKSCTKNEFPLHSEKAFSKMLEETIFTISLIIDGLIKKQEKNV
jgi:AcrR family transcriptional regulator